MIYYYFLIILYIFLLLLFFLQKHFQILKIIQNHLLYLNQVLIFPYCIINYLYFFQFKNKIIHVRNLF